MRGPLKCLKCINNSYGPVYENDAFQCFVFSCIILLNVKCLKFDRPPFPIPCPSSDIYLIKFQNSLIFIIFSKHCMHNFDEVLKY